MIASPGKLSHIFPLDGVRGIAALMIMVFHYWQGDGLRHLGIPDGISKLAVFGQTGVDLFFVLSGFLITRILIFTKDQPHYFRDFYGRRALRILPLYYLFLVIYCFVLPWLEQTPVDPFGKTWWYWFYLQNVPDTFTSLASAGPFHYWSLAVEEHFYMFWPLVVYFAPVRSLERFSLAVIVAAMIFRGIFIFGFKAGVFYFTLCRMDALAFGTLLACLEATGSLARYRKAGMITLAALLPVLVILWIRLTGSGADLLQLVKFSLIGLIYMAALGLVILYKDSIWIAQSFGNRILRSIGQISYGLYVYHGLCFHFINQTPFVGRIPILNFLASFAAAFLVSWFSFRFFETLFLRQKHFFSPSVKP